MIYVQPHLNSLRPDFGLLHPAVGIFDAVPLILVVVAQQIAMQLTDLVFVDGDICPAMKHRFHDIGISSDFLLVAAGERFDLQPGEQLLNLAVAELATLYSG